MALNSLLRAERERRASRTAAGDSTCSRAHTWPAVGAHSSPHLVPAPSRSRTGHNGEDRVSPQQPGGGAYVVPPEQGFSAWQLTPDPWAGSIVCLANGGLCPESTEASDFEAGAFPFPRGEFCVTESPGLGPSVSRWGAYRRPSEPQVGGCWEALCLPEDLLLKVYGKRIVGKVRFRSLLLSSLLTEGGGSSGSAAGDTRPRPLHHGTSSHTPFQFCHVDKKWGPGPWAKWCLCFGRWRREDRSISVSY